MDKSLCRLTTIWVDGGWWRTLPDVGDGRLPIVQVVLRPNKPRASCCSKTVGGRAHLRLADGLSAIGQQTLSCCQ